MLIFLQLKSQSALLDYSQFFDDNFPVIFQSCILCIKFFLEVLYDDLMMILR